MTGSKNQLMLKGLEDEVYTGTADGRIVGVSERMDRYLPDFHTEPDMRNPEYPLPPLRSYEEIGAALVRSRSRLRDWLQDQGSYTLIPGATMSTGDSTAFFISDPGNGYYRFIRDAYGTRVVTTSTHISIGLTDGEDIVRASRLLRAEACLFLALTAASPFLDGKVTGHHSTRWAVFPPIPARVPLFESRAEYELFVEEAIADGRMKNNRHLWVSARPNGPHTPHHLNRAELRICDHIYDPHIVLGVAALAEARIQQLMTDPSLDPLVASDLRGPNRIDDIRKLVEENEAAVADRSLDATVRHWQTGDTVPVREWLDDYLSGAQVTADALGFGRYLQPLQQIVEDGNVAMRWLEQHDQGSSIGSIIAQEVTAMKEAEQSI